MPRVGTSVVKFLLLTIVLTFNSFASTNMSRLNMMTLVTTSGFKNLQACTPFIAAEPNESTIQVK